MTHRATIAVDDAVDFFLEWIGKDSIGEREVAAHTLKNLLRQRGEAERAQANIAGISAGEITAREIYEKTGLALSDEQVQIIQKNTDWWLDKERLAVSTPPVASVPDVFAILKNRMDWHDVQGAMADATGYSESVEHHDTKIKVYKEVIADLQTAAALSPAQAALNTEELLKLLKDYREDCPCESGSITRTPCDFCTRADKFLK